jgi:prevent-host-death family protein
MMTKVNVHEAKTQLSRLLERVLQGEEIAIARYGKPVATLVPLAQQPARRTPGSARGRALLDTHALLGWISDDERLSQEAREFISNG